MKIIPVILDTEKSLRNNIQNTYNRLSMIQKSGNEVALRASSIYKHEDKLGEYKRTAKFRKFIKEITPYNLPLIGAVVGFISPIPGASVAFFTIGGIAGSGMILYNKVKSHKKDSQKSLDRVS